MSFPSPEQTKDFIESLEGASGISILNALEHVEVEEGVKDRSLYFTALVCAAAIYLRKRFEVWTSFVENKKHFWVKYEGVNINSWVPKDKPLRESSNIQMQTQIREWALDAMKEARPRKRIETSSLLKFNGWVSTNPVNGVIRQLKRSGNKDLARRVEHIVKGE